MTTHDDAIRNASQLSNSAVRLTRMVTTFKAQFFNSQTNHPRWVRNDARGLFFVRRHDARFYFDNFPKSGFRTARCSYSLAILAHHCGRLSTIFKPRFATRLVATISFELCTQFWVPCSALCSAPCSALCALHACALRSATCSALCTVLQHDPHFNSTTTSFGLFFCDLIRRLLGSSTSVPAHSGCHWPSSRSSGLSRSAAGHSDLAPSLSMYLKQTQQHWCLSLLAT
ncbi:hypothetical protein DAPPUDRAFT_110341 [Daphnia pulex]|uniref:Uncharacterized protein n=1 Tax=Daphnia pulex TaxID=6669 RepID=E9H612_DAPPU|nr:hypothetical protein DAPPUDRAFT_110341 [Daphnia pulex]|eukprot:EFX72817.1 hypothetical protein DAPPUDRAFT_110341 [Daphnia pulex]